MFYTDIMCKSQDDAPIANLHKTNKYGIIIIENGYSN